MNKRKDFGKSYIIFVFILWAGTEVLFSSTLESIFGIPKSVLNDRMAVIILALLLIHIIFFQQYQIRELAILAIISLPIIYATINSGNNRMMSTWIFIVAAKDIEFDRIIKLTYYVELIASLFVIYLFEIGAITEFSMYRGSVLRHSLGFVHPNQLGMRVFLLIACRCYIRRGKFNILDWLIIIISAYFVNTVSNSKTSFFSLLILAIIMAAYELVRSLDGNLRLLSSIMISISVFVNLISIVLSFINVKKYPILNLVDKVMSRRFSQCHRTLQYYGINAFGQKIELIFSRVGIGRVYHFWLDNAYMAILMRYGVIVFVLFSLLYYYTMGYLRHNERYLLVAFMGVYSIYGVMENNFFSISHNIFLLLLALPIYQKEMAVEELMPSKIRLMI